MTANSDAYYQYSCRQGEDIFLVVSPLAEGVDKFMERVNELRGKIPNPSGSVPPADTYRKPTSEYSENAPQNTTEVKSFQIESLEFVGKERWLAKGGNFKKFGVTVFKEVLAAAGILASLSMEKPNNPSGTWYAHYSERIGEDGKSKPDKVLELVKG